MSGLPRRQPGMLVMVAAALCASNAAQTDTADTKGGPVMKFTVRVAFGKDVGQNFGSLFEAPTADGRFVIGAGFPGLYNTRHRSDRYAVQFFVRPTNGKREFTIKRLPRPSVDAGAYMFDLDGTLYSSGRPPRSWNEAAEKWEDDPNPLPGRMCLGEGMLLFADDHAEYNGKTILTKPEQGAYQRLYYAHGHWFFYHTYWAGKRGYRAYETDAKGFTKLHAVPWLPDTGEPADLSRAHVYTLPCVGEVPFAYGQLGADVLTCSNLGGVYLFDGRAWRTLKEPEIGVSHQIYSVLNFYDRLLMGHYPTGLLYEFDGESLTLREGWPPRLEGVAKNAREAQTTAIYGGDLFVGVWPWGEVWRYNRDADEWRWVRRMFTHPLVTDETTHPYENECIGHDLVTNQWGQRVTSLVPLGGSLMISTSAKWPCEWKPEFKFLGDDKWKEYGSVFRLTMPGHLSAPVRWTQGETELEFILSGDEMRITQDGKSLASTRMGAALAAEIARAAKLGECTWRHGVFGRFGGATLEGTVTPASALH